jgi:hypothetical protein
MFFLLLGAEVYGGFPPFTTEKKAPLTTSFKEVKLLFLQNFLGKGKS